MERPKDPKRWIGRKVKLPDGEVRVITSHSAGHRNWQDLTPVGPLGWDGFPIEVGDEVTHLHVGDLGSVIEVGRAGAPTDRVWVVWESSNSDPDIYSPSGNLRVTKPCGVEEKPMTATAASMRYRADMDKIKMRQEQFNHLFNYGTFRKTTKTKQEKTVRTLSPQAKKNMDPNLVLVLEELTDERDYLEWSMPELREFEFDFWWKDHSDELIDIAKKIRAEREKK